LVIKLFFLQEGILNQLDVFIVIHKKVKVHPEYP
jgi:hypothetical protein